MYAAYSQFLCIYYETEFGVLIDNLFDGLGVIGQVNQSLPLRGRWIARKGETEEGQ